MIASAKQALAFARGEKDHGCVVHTPEEIAARKKGGFLVAANLEDGLEVPVRASVLDTTE